MPELAFIVTNSHQSPDPTTVISWAAANGLGLTLQPTESTDVATFLLEGGETLIVTFVRSAIPNLGDYPGGPTSASPSDLCQAANHLVLEVPDFAFEPATVRLIMSVLSAAVASATDAVGVLVGGGIVFHRPETFIALAKAAASEPAPPPMMMVEIAAYPESGNRMALLSHGLQHVGSEEELYVTCPLDGQGAMDFTYRLIEGFANDPSLRYETGDTVGRSSDEAVVVQRQSHPNGEGLPVMRLDLIPN